MNWEQYAYLSLSTRKRDGSRVETPVWFANQGDTFFIFSEAKAGKIKRIRNFSDVTIAPCSVTGKITGKAISGCAKILTTPEEIHQAHQKLIEKYRWKMRLLNLGSALAGKINKRAFVQITLTNH